MTTPLYPRARKHPWSRPGLLPLLLLLLLAALSGHACADGIWDDCVRHAHSVYQYFPAATVELGRDAGRGDVVGPWLEASAIGWVCTRRPSAAGETVSVSVQGYAPYLKYRSLVYDGETYGEYSFSLTTPALSYIARWRAVIDGIATDWTPLTANPGIYQLARFSVPVTKAAGETYLISIQTQIRLVKFGNVLAPGYRQAIIDPMYVRHAQEVGNRVSYGSGTYRISQMPSRTLTFVGGGTCTTPDIDVVMPDAPASNFKGVGSTSRGQPFELRFDNCPPGLARIEYSLAATTAVLDANNGVVALDGASTASGVGVQLRTATGDPLVFGFRYPLSQYDPHIQGSYKVGLHARLYQTDPIVAAGRASTAITFTAYYK